MCRANEGFICHFQIRFTHPTPGLSFVGCFRHFPYKLTIHRFTFPSIIPFIWNLFLKLLFLLNVMLNSRIPTCFTPCNKGFIEFLTPDVFFATYQSPSTVWSLNIHSPSVSLFGWKALCIVSSLRVFLSSSLISSSGNIPEDSNCPCT